MESDPSRTPSLPIPEQVGRGVLADTSVEGQLLAPTRPFFLGFRDRFGRGFRAFGPFGSFFESVPPLASDACRIERVFATSRLFLGMAILLAYFQTTPEANSRQMLWLLAYSGYSAGIWGFLRLQPSLSAQVPIALHALDVLWAAAITSATGGVVSPLLGVFLFVLLEAGYRWGLRATVATMVTVISFLFAQTALLNASGPHPASAPVDGAIARAAYLAIGGLLLGYVAGRERQHREEMTTIARLTRSVRAELGMMGSLKALFPELLHLFGPRAILLVSQEPRRGRLCLWQAEDPPNKGHNEEAVWSRELAPSERAVYLFPIGVEAWHAVSGVSGLRPIIKVRGLASEGHGVQDVPSAAHERFAARHPFHSLFGVSLSVGAEWVDRIFLLDPQGGMRDLQFLVRLVRELRPALQSVYRLDRLRSHVGEIERARVARELHDGTIQSLIGLEMELAAGRRGFRAVSPLLAGQLDRFQQRLREEIVNLRELTQRLRPVQVEPAKLPSYLSDMVSRFQRETGIAASFVSKVDGVDLPQQVCCEIARIVQEALVNVRRHSGAHNVLVRLGDGGSSWVVKVDDDGCGFDFTGRCSHVELDAAGKGPAVIKERVRLLGGELTLDSNPNRGARLEITVPATTHA